jgi:hypothetical protein
VDHRTHQEITAATAAHHELGPGYDDAVAEGLVERIGEEIDRRVDARLGRDGTGTKQRGETAKRRASGEVSAAARPTWSVVLLGLGSMGIGAISAAAVLNASNGGGNAWLVAVIWIVIAVINISYANPKRH